MISLPAMLPVFCRVLDSRHTDFLKHHPVSLAAVHTTWMTNWLRYGEEDARFGYQICKKFGVHPDVRTTFEQHFFPRYRVAEYNLPANTVWAGVVQKLKGAASEVHGTLFVLPARLG